MYVVPRDSDGSFQNALMTSRIRSDDDVIETARRKVSVAGALIQSVLAESMEVHGFGRKTIQFANQGKFTKVLPIFLFANWSYDDFKCL